MREIVLLFAVFAMPNTFRYADVASVHDGDTVTLSIRIGDGSGRKVVVTDNVRLEGIDAPELSRPGGKESREHLKFVCDYYRLNHGSVVVEMLGEDKYGRLLGRLWGVDGYDAPLNINEAMIKTGHAVEYHGGKRLP